METDAPCVPSSASLESSLKASSRLKRVCLRFEFPGSVRGGVIAPFEKDVVKSVKTPGVDMSTDGAVRRLPLCDMICYEPQIAFPEGYKVICRVRKIVLSGKSWYWAAEIVSSRLQCRKTRG